MFLQPQAQTHQSGQQQHNQSQQNNQQQIQTNQQQQQQTYTIPGTNIQIPASAINAANLQNIKVEGAGKCMKFIQLTLSSTTNHLTLPTY